MFHRSSVLLTQHAQQHQRPYHHSLQNKRAVRHLNMEIIHFWWCKLQVDISSVEGAIGGPDAHDWCQVRLIFIKQPMCVGSWCWERKQKAAALFKAGEVCIHTVVKYSLLPQQEPWKTINVCVDTANTLAFLGLHLHDVLVCETVSSPVFAVSQVLILHEAELITVPSSCCKNWTLAKMCQEPF